MGRGERDYGIVAFVAHGGLEYAVLAPKDQIQTPGAPLMVSVFRCERLSEEQYKLFPVEDEELELALLGAFEICTQVEGEET